jgi:Lipocalin-like domain
MFMSVNMSIKETKMLVSTRTRMSEKALRERLVGAWTLTSYVLRDIKTGGEDRPFGERPLGYILYTPDGYMSVS